MRKTILFLLFLAIPAPAFAQSAAADIEVSEAVIATGVVDRQPVGEAQSVPADVGQVVLWTQVTGAHSGTVLQHVWHYEGREIDRIGLDIGGPSWRTWSRKTVPADWTGDWHVDIVAPGGEVLRSVSFTVR